MRKIIILLLMILTAGAARAVEGDWHGRLEVMGTKLTLVLHINGEEATLDSPDQGAKGIPASVVHNSPDSLAIAVEAIGMTYSARMADGMLKGTFEQHGLRLPLDLEAGLPERRRPQTPQPPFPYSTEDLTFVNPADGATLGGTLTLPEGMTRQTPVVVMVSGSGQQDRDETIFDHKPFAVVADYLARRGIASFRYDDRGVGASGGLRPDLTTADFKSDALAAVEMLRQRGVSDFVGILGHSEGGLIAFMIAGDNPQAVDFIATMAGTAQRGDAVLMAQFLRIGAHAGQTPSPLEVMGAIADLCANSPWMDYFATYDPAPAIRRIACPVFAANGTNDVQVDVANLDAIKSNLRLKAADKIVAYEGLNHLFQHCATGFSEEYGEIEETIAPQYLADLADWIKSLQLGDNAAAK